MDSMNSINYISSIISKKFQGTNNRVIFLIFAISFIFFFIFYFSNFSKKISKKFSENFEDLSHLSRYFSHDKHIPYPKYRVKKEYIFVSIASYRDSLCSKTIESLFENASSPSRIYVGICSQNSENISEECIPQNFRFKNHIRIHRLKHTEALGPTYARYLCSHLWRGEEYYLQIDSHMLFDEDWDKDLLNMYSELPHEKCAITAYPPSFENTKNPATYTCKAEFKNINEKEGTFDIISSSLETHLDKAILTPYFSACLFFSKSSFLYEVPFDPYLPYLFQGEEPLMAMRLYTSGWDLYNPPKSVCSHKYVKKEDKDRPKFWDDNKLNFHQIQKETKKRYLKIISQDVECKPEFLKEIEYYGLGKIRDIDSYFKFAGIDMKNKTITSRCNIKM
tara:strand:+ start:7491 stop:8669 length:1179 start_codon:yes stop_codon:yes gene_type:complete